MTTTTPTPPEAEARATLRRRASYVSLGVGLLVFAIKLLGWRLTGSAVVLADALESIVNVAAAGFAIFAIRFASKPADRDHPYGHGKIELLAAAFEGGLISFAALMIFYTSSRSLFFGVELRELDLGLAITAGAGVINLLLGSWILRVGRATASPTLVADGRHILSDVWTTLGVLVGLALVLLTGIEWLDPLAGMAVGLLLARTGWQLVQESANALLDVEDPALLQTLVDAFNDAPVQGVTNLHRLRAIRSGDLVHVDAHVFVPAHWSVEEAHRAVMALEAWVAERAGFEGELALHLDPCHEEVCSSCDLPACPVRTATSNGRRRLSLEDAVGPSGLAPTEWIDEGD